MIIIGEGAKNLSAKSSTSWWRRRRSRKSRRKL